MALPLATSVRGAHRLFNSHAGTYISVGGFLPTWHEREPRG